MQQILYVQFTNKHQQKWKVIWQKERFHWSIEHQSVVRKFSGHFWQKYLPVFCSTNSVNVKSKYIFWRIKLSNDFTNKSIWFCIIIGRYWWSNGSIYRNRSFRARKILMTHFCRRQISTKPFCHHHSISSTKSIKMIRTIKKVLRYWLWWSLWNIVSKLLLQKQRN